MKVFVTGADGMLGSHIVRELINRGHEVTAFVLPHVNCRSLEGLNVNLKPGNILNPDEIYESIVGCKAIIHAAADTSVWPSRSDRVRAVNIEGTRNLIEAAKRIKVARFIHIGSASSFGFGSKQCPGDELAPYVGGKFGLDYIDSKFEGQQLVLKAVIEEGLPALVITPTFMFGPYDSKPGSGQMIIAAYRKKLTAYTKGGKNFVFTKDVAVAVANALIMGRVGECYIAGNENLSYKEIISLMAEELKVPGPKFMVPGFLLSVFGIINAALARAFGIKPGITYPMAKVALVEQYFSSNKAVQELKMPQTDIRIAVREAFDWFRKNKYC